MDVFAWVRLDTDTPIKVNITDYEPSGHLSIGHILKGYIRLDGDTEKLCELHDKLGQLIAHRLAMSANDPSSDNPLNLADETADISEEIKPF